MKTTAVSPEQMSGRIARYERLKPLLIQQAGLAPVEIVDLVYARELLPVLGLEHGETGLTDNVPIRGAGGITITYARCPPGTGPGLHAHRQTYETFTVLRGAFQFFWGDNAEHSAQLSLFDTLSVPPGCCRAFRNTAQELGVLQVLISGGVHDMNDIDFRPDIGVEIERKAQRFYDSLTQRGFTFTAGLP